MHFTYDFVKNEYLLSFSMLWLMRFFLNKIQKFKHLEIHSLFRTHTLEDIDLNLIFNIILK